MVLRSIIWKWDLNLDYDFWSNLSQSHITVNRDEVQISARRKGNRCEGGKGAGLGVRASVFRHNNKLYDCGTKFLMNLQIIEIDLISA